MPSAYLGLGRASFNFIGDVVKSPSSHQENPVVKFLLAADDGAVAMSVNLSFGKLILPLESINRGGL